MKENRGTKKLTKKQFTGGFYRRERMDDCLNGNKRAMRRGIHFNWKSRMHDNKLHIKEWRDDRRGGGNEGRGQDRFGSPSSGGNNKKERKRKREARREENSLEGNIG